MTQNLRIVHAGQKIWFLIKKKTCNGTIINRAWRCFPYHNKKESLGAVDTKNKVSARMLSCQHITNDLIWLALCQLICFGLLSRLCSAIIAIFYNGETKTSAEYSARSMRLVQRWPRTRLREGVTHRRTDGLTDGRMDGLTDGRTDRLIEMRRRI